AGRRCARSATACSSPHWPRRSPARSCTACSRRTATRWARTTCATRSPCSGTTRPRCWSTRCTSGTPCSRRRSGRSTTRPRGRSAGLWRAGGVVRVRSVAAWVAVGALAVGACAGGRAVGYGWPRRLVGHGSIFTESRLEQRFNRRPRWLADYVWAADAVRAAGARRVGLVQGEDTWEYPWWVLLRDEDIEPLQSIVPGHQPAVAPRNV